MKKSERTRKRILDAAAHWLTHKGLAATSLRELAEETNIRTASIYYYFESKDALVEEVLRIGIEVVHQSVKERVEMLGEEVNFQQRIETAITAHLYALLMHGNYTSAHILNYSFVSLDIRQRVLKVRREYGEYWQDLLEQAQKAGDIAPHVDLGLLRLFLIGALNWSVEWFDAEVKSVERLAKDCCEMIFNGISGHSTSAGVTRHDVLTCPSSTITHDR